MNQYQSSKYLHFCFMGLFYLLPILSFAQPQQADTLLKEVTLKTAVEYAVKRQPLIQQSLIDEQITATQLKSRLADWYPQLNFNYNIQHNFLLQKSLFAGNLVTLGQNNTSAAQFSASQYLFNRDLLLAKRTRVDVRLQAQQATASNKIDLVVNVSKAFYDILSTTQQIKVAAENITRIERSLKDAFNQFQAGLTDKTDYKRATITLNNSRASLRGNEELLKAKKEYLRALMNYPEKYTLNIVYDTLQMETEIGMDTALTADYKLRIEYRILETQSRLLQANIKYNKWAYLPTLSANGAYNFNFQNNDFTKLYNANYPNSYVALTLGFPIFQGGKRKFNIQQAQLEFKRNEWEIVNLENSVNSVYAQALAAYRANLENYTALKENVSLAKEVYDVIQLQYRSGIKTYLEVITSETDLRTAQINYYTAIYELLASKLDVKKASGQIIY
ncbi:MAG: TolC family protein [Ferruginibacter sp.]|nr:TolC family protein [Ferruginibacter sp.]